MPLIGLGNSDPSRDIQAEGQNVVGANGTQGIRVNLSSFRQIVNDFARPHLFQIDIPSIDSSSIALTMLAKSSILPPMTVEDKSFEFQGSKYKMAGHATFDDWNVTFVADEYHKLRHRFLAWQSMIFDPVRQLPFTAGSYKKNDVKVIQLSKDADVVTAYKFYGLYPARVGEIQLSQGSKEVEEFTVTFAYDYYSIDTQLPATWVPEMADVAKDSYKYTENYNTFNRDFNANKEHSSNLLQDKAGNADQDYNGRGNTQPAPLGFVADQLKKLNPFGRNGDINTTDPFTFLDAANWMNFRYSPPLRFRIRKYLGSDVNNGIDKFRAPEINPYDWTGLEKKV